MICPHCEQSLLQKERTGRRCSSCKRPFALEPKSSPLAMHDIRVRKLVERLSGGRDLHYALLQLWYAAGRAKVTNPGAVFGKIRVAIGFVIAIVTFYVVVSGVIARPVALLLGFAVLVAVQIFLGAIRPGVVRTGRLRIPGTYLAFRKEVVERWPAVYGDLPPGAVDESAAIATGSPRPSYVVLSPDRGVLACLAANYPAHGLELAVADRIDRLPPIIPVIVLHDASVPGLLFASQARAALGPRAVPAGLTPRAVLAKTSSLRLREKAPDRAELAQLPRDSLSQAEIDWLGVGWWSPVAALPPAKLIATVRRAIERIEDAIDPDRRHARAIGFLTWPTS